MENMNFNEKLFNYELLSYMLELYLCWHAWMVAIDNSDRFQV